MFRSIRLALGSSIAAFVLLVSGADASSSAGPDQRVQSQHAAFVEALKPLRPGMPVVAVLALNEGTEMTDLLLPHAILARSGVVDVQVVAAHAGTISLYPALRLKAEQDLSGFDRLHPAGADYVIVPAMQPDNDPELIHWLQQQANKGARIMSVCSGARVLGQAGLLDGRRFTGHWYDRSTLLQRHPTAVHVPDQRYLADGNVMTTTGITASLPATLALVEAIGGKEKAGALAAELGVVNWGPAHDSEAFGLNLKTRAGYLLNKAAFWRVEDWRVNVHDGMDDIALALVVDAWSRTGRVSLQAVSQTEPVSLRSGLVLLAQASPGASHELRLMAGVKPVQQLDLTLCEIARRYGTSRRDWVMQEMEYAGSAGTATCEQ